MGTTRIDGKDGVVISGTQYLELPKGNELNRPTTLRVGMMRYNNDVDTNKRGVQVVIGAATANGVVDPTTLEWRGVAVVDPATGKIDSASLPASILGSASYQGTWNAATNVPPITAPGAAGRYYIVGDAGNGAGASNLVPADVTAGFKVGDWVVSTGSIWDKIDYTATTTTATAVEMSSAGMRVGKHSMAGVTILQTGFERIVESAVDRLSGDIMEANLTFDNTKAAYLHIKNGTTSLPGIAFGTDTDTGLYSSVANNISVATGGNTVATFNKDSVNVTAPTHEINGTPLKPAYSFSTDDNTGMYLSGTDEISFSTGGTKRMTVATSGVTLDILRIGNGSALTPALNFASDTNTGIYKAGEDTIGFSTNGSPRLILSDTSAVYSVPLRALTGSAGAPTYSFSSDTSTGIYSPVAGSVAIASGGVHQVDVTKTAVAIATKTLVPNGTALLPTYSFIDDHNTGIFSPAPDNISLTAGGVAIATISTTELTTFKPIRTEVGTATIPAYSFSAEENTGMYRKASGILAFSTNGTDALVLGNGSLQSSNKFIIPSGPAAAPGLVFSNNTDTGLFSNSSTSMGLTVDGVAKLELDTTLITASQPIVGKAGSLPSFAFIGDTTTGLYSASAGNVGLTVSGTSILGCTNSAITTNTPVRAITGSATVPSYSFADNTNVGMFRPAADQVALTVGAAKITATTSNVITSVPLHALSGTASAPAYSFNGDSDTGMYRVNTDQIGFSANASNVMTLSKSSIKLNTVLDLGIDNAITWTGSTAPRKSSINATNDGSALRFEASSSSAPFSFGAPARTYMSLYPYALSLPIGTSANVGSALAGMIRYDETVHKFFGYRNNAWIELGADLVATATNALHFDGKTYVQAKTDIRSGLLTAADTISTANLAHNSLKFEGKTYAQAYADIRSNLLTAASLIDNAKHATTADSATLATTANNAIRFDNKTYAEVYAAVRAGLMAVGDTATNSSALDGSSKASIINTARTGLLLTSGTAADTSKFQGLTYVQAKADILAGTAANATQLGGISYSQLIANARDGLLTTASTAANSALLQGLNKDQVVAEARAGKAADSFKLEGFTKAQILAEAKAGNTFNTKTTTKTTLFDSAAGTLGSVTLSAPYDQFDEIWIYIGDNTVGFIIQQASWNTDALDEARIMSNPTTVGLDLVSTLHYFYRCKISADRRIFTRIDGNSKIYKIIGAKFKWSA